MPIPLISLLRISPLLVIVGFVGDVNDLIEQASTQLRVVLGLGGRFVGLHFSAANDAFLHDCFGGLLHGSEHGGLLLFGVVFVDLSTALELAFT